MSVEHVKRLKAAEIAVRFVFGGTVCVITGLITHRWGSRVGGLFLGFPAILPASLTMISHEFGRKGASQDAQGASLGAVGLAVFGVAAALLVGRIAFPLVLVIATTLWFSASAILWRVFLYVDTSAIDRDVVDPAARPSAKRES